MDGLPARQALVFVHLKLVTIFEFVEDKCFSVGTEGFLLPGFLGLVRVRRGGYNPPGGSIFLVRLLGWCTSVTALSSCYHRIHSFHHRVHVGLVRCCHRCDLFVVCSCSIANNIACNSPSSSAAAVSWARSAASLNRNCFAVVVEYRLRSSHLWVKYFWSAAHVCCAAVLFSHATIWSSVNILLFQI